LKYLKIYDEEVDYFEFLEKERKLKRARTCVNKLKEKWSRIKSQIPDV
jgi:hypothetical protein